MSRTAFDETKPAGNQTGPSFAASANANDTALRDACLMGLAEGFDLTVSGGTAGQPALFYWKKSTTWLRATPTWGSGAGKDGNIVSMAWDLSTNSGSSYDAIGTTALSFDTSGNLTTATGVSGWVAWLWGLMGKAYKLAADLATHVALTGSSAHGLGTISTQAASAVAITGGSASLTYEREAKVAKGNVAGSTAIDWAAGGLQTLTVTGSSAALTWSNLPSGVVGYLTLDVANGAIATSLFTAQKPGGTALSWTNPGRDVVTLMCHDGATVSVVGFAKDVK
jgi:hypothetical protein